jgi:mRNA (2'-O-methyladenosine-N6-)-methyltransferase
LVKVSLIPPDGEKLINSHTCEHLLVAVKVPPTHPADAGIPWTTHPTLMSLRKGIDTDVVVAEVRETSRKPDEVYGVIERYVPSLLCLS